MYSERVIPEFIELIYDAAGNPAGWPIFLERLRKALHSTATNLFAQDLRSQEFNVAAAVGMDPFFQQAYADYYRTKNVYLIRGSHLLRTGSVYPSETLCPDDKLGLSASTSKRVTVQPPNTVSITVSPTSVTVTSGGTQQFTVTVANTTNQAVTWTAAAGTISADGLLTAPVVLTSRTITVTATSAADSSKTASATVTVQPVHGHHHKHSN